MDCRTGEFYIVDYFLEDLDKDSKEDLLKHLNSCDECRVSYIKYKELINISRIKDNKNSPRLEILDRLQQIARINSQKDESFFKKITKFRFFVPLFGSAMVLMVLLNIDTDSFLNLKQNNQHNIQEAQTASSLNDRSNQSADDLPEAEKKSISENELPSKRIKKEFDRALIVGSPNNRTVSISGIEDELSIARNLEPQFIKNIDSNYFNDSQEHFYKSKATIENISDTKLAKSENSILKNEESLKEDIIGRAPSLNSSESLSEGLEVASAAPSSDLLNLKTNENFALMNDNGLDSEFNSIPSDNCNYKKSESLDLLNNEEISFNQKKMAYTTLAECHEFEGNWKEALDNYISLQNFDSGSKDIYQKKIDFIKTNYIDR